MAIQFNPNARSKKLSAVAFDHFRPERKYGKISCKKKNNAWRKEIKCR